MGLAFYDEDQVLLDGSDKFRPYVNGYLGGAHEEIIYLRNDDVSRWYTNITVSLVTTTYDGAGELGTSGYSFKFMYGERRPTEAEWDTVISGASLTIPDIGTTVAADTSTYHPVWIRVYVPGNTPASINETFSIRLSYFPRLVGA